MGKRIAEKLTLLNIFWVRKTLIFLNVRRYTPDFYFPEYDIYLEIKGWWKDNDILKMKHVLNEHNIDLRVIDSLKDIKKFENDLIDIFSLKKIKDIENYHKEILNLKINNYNIYTKRKEMIITKIKENINISEGFYNKEQFNFLLKELKIGKKTLKKYLKKLNLIRKKEKQLMCNFKKAIEKNINNAKIKNLLLVEKLKTSNIDFTKFGWVKEAAKFLNKHPQKINQWIKKYAPEIYDIAFKRKMAS